jgi:hypothetical protein
MTAKEDLEREARLRGAFRRVFGSDDGRIVLASLAKFAAEGDEGYVADVQLLQYIRGRRSVLCEIRRHIGGGEDVRN